MAAASVGLGCELVVWGDPRSPNLALARAVGARVIATGDEDRNAVDALVAARAAELTASGRPAYPVPRGGSTELGAAGFALAAAELADQLDHEPDNHRPELIVLAVGSGGSCAGLVAGLAAEGLDTPVLGASVSRPPQEIAARVWELATGCAQLLGTPLPVNRPEIVDARGPGLGTATELERDRARLALRTEGLLLDHTYGAEAFSALVDRATGGPVLFWHTGGVVPAALCSAHIYATPGKAGT
jgi:1-aminocyclopropane-1-carboxylate deaminase/D-cysteine desulfhydrase-like pyridoxal-dependent ACC family enzyme